MSPLERAALGDNGRRYFMANFHLPDRISELLALFRDQVQRT
jgi:hypothetical protein